MMPVKFWLLLSQEKQQAELNHRYVVSELEIKLLLELFHAVAYAQLKTSGEKSPYLSRTTYK